MVRDHDQIVAVGLLTQADLNRLGSGFRNAIPVDETPMFEELLRAIDEADEQRAARLISANGRDADHKII